jgi:DNA-binding CsgD family transcriptional regulator
VSIAPLRKTTIKGALYTRPAEIEAKLQELAGLPREELVRRCEVTDEDDPPYVPSECVLHFVRACRGENSSSYFERLYKVIVGRVRQRLPKPETGAGTQSLALENLRDDAFGRFTKLMAEDYGEYAEKLDYFEIRFNGAVKKLRLDSCKKGWREAKKRGAPLEIDPESGEFSGKAEKAGGSFDPFDPENFRLEDYRSRLDGAIDVLTPDQRRIVEMIRKKIPIDSKDPNTLTIAKALGKSEKTIRTYRDQAYAAIRAFRRPGEAP